MTMKEMLSMLLSLRDLLREEKNILVNSEGEKLETLLQRKTKLMEEISRLGTENSEMVYTPEEKEEYNRLLQETKELQETNLLLTRQSLYYMDAVLEQLCPGAEGGKYYGKKGSVPRDSAFSSFVIDHSV